MTEHPVFRTNPPRHGWHNHPPFKDEVKSGGHEYPFRMSRQCKYDLKPTDPACTDCKWRDD